MQRASSTQVHELALSGNLHLQVLPGVYAHMVHAGQAGVFAQLSMGLLGDLANGFKAVLRDYRSKASFPMLGGESCNNCSLTVKAFGFESRNCSIIEKAMPYPEGEDAWEIVKVMYNYTDIFKIDVSTVKELVSEDTAEGLLNITVTRKVATAGDVDVSYLDKKLLTQSCLLRPAIMSYDMIVDSGYATFASNSWRDDTVVQLL